MAHEMVILQESPLETERLLGAAAFGDAVDMSAFETAYAQSNTVIPGFNSLVETPEDSAAPDFNSFIGAAPDFNSFIS
jgi:hypothetical protein